MTQLEQAIADLQKRAADPEVAVAQLVREALALASQSKDEDMAAWLRAEMNGYSIMREAPEHRWTEGRVVVWNAYRGWVAVVFRDPADEERVSRVATTQGIGEVEALLKEDTSRGSFGVAF